MIRKVASGGNFEVSCTASAKCTAGPWGESQVPGGLKRRLGYSSRPGVGFPLNQPEFCSH